MNFRYHDENNLIGFSDKPAIATADSLTQVGSLAPQLTGNLSEKNQILYNFLSQHSMMVAKALDQLNQ